MNGILMLIIVILLIALIIAGVNHIRYRRQIREICRQLAFHNRELTNQEIRIDVRSKEMLELQETLTEMFEKSKELEIQYQKADENLKNMITNISHDIRTPLTSIDGYFQLLCTTTDEQEKQKYAEIIRSRIQSLSMILEQLFTYVRVQNSELQMELVRCDVKQCLCENLFSFYEDFKRKKIEPTVGLPEEECYAYLDESLLQRVFQNILKNALVHGDTKITVVLKRQNGSVLVDIRNHTEEQHSEEPKLVFERFFQGDRARNNQSSGLGLCIAKELVEQMGGTIRAYYQKSDFGIEMAFKEMERY